MPLEIGLGVLGAMIVVMLAAWAFGLAVKNGGWTDIFWTWGTGLTLAAAALWPSAGGVDPRPVAVAIMVGLWGIRLGLYLTPRVAGHPEDPRYAVFREQWGKSHPLRMLGVTLPQAFATALLAISVAVAAHGPATSGVQFYAGVGLWAFALAFEGVAVGQMKRFRGDPNSKGQVMDRGLWAWSRHPNYFFQWLGWLAYPVIALDPAHPETWLSLTAPVVMYLLLRYVSGVPPLEQAMLKSRGDKFRDYQQRVSVFFPVPPKRVASE